MDGAVDATAPQERGVRGVDDGADALAREVAARDLQPAGADRPRKAAIGTHVSVGGKGEGARGAGGAPRARVSSFAAPTPPSSPPSPPPTSTRPRPRTSI